MQRKALFDLVRRLLGRGFRQAEVEALDHALDRLTAQADAGADFLPQDSVTTGPCLAPNGRDVGPEGIALIKRFEGCARLRPDGLVEAYPDPGTGGAPWTIGWGATGSGIGPGTLWSQDECDRRLEADLVRYAGEVEHALGDAPTTQQQFDALVSFHYNTGAIRRATLTRRHCAGDHAGAAAEFARWVHSGGKVLKGLVRRRAAEAELYSGADGP